jgi:hypothetical protein
MPGGCRTSDAEWNANDVCSGLDSAVIVSQCFQASEYGGPTDSAWIRRTPAHSKDIAGDGKSGEYAYSRKVRYIALNETVALKPLKAVSLDDRIQGSTRT